MLLTTGVKGSHVQAAGGEKRLARGARLPLTGEAEGAVTARPLALLAEVAGQGGSLTAVVGDQVEHLLHAGDLPPFMLETATRQLRRERRGVLGLAEPGVALTGIGRAQLCPAVLGQVFQGA